MEINKFYITLICVVLALPVFADGLKEKTDNWLKSENNLQTGNWLQTESWLQAATDGTGRPGIGAEIPSADPTVNGPISDSPLFFLLLGGLAYGMYAIRKRIVKMA